MARKTLNYTVTDEGRDKGKTFLITEMSASQAERWAMRAFLAMAQGGVEVPEEMVKAGFAGLAKYGLTMISKLPFDTADALMREMFECVTLKTDSGFNRDLVEDDIEEIGTRLKLRLAVLELHGTFSKAAVPSN